MVPQATYTASGSNYVGLPGGTVGELSAQLRPISISSSTTSGAGSGSVVAPVPRPLAAPALAAAETPSPSQEREPVDPKVKHLMALGLTVEDARTALNYSSGDVNFAASWHFETK